QRDGWPVGRRPPEGSEFVASLVRAPAPGDPGAVYLWAQPPGATKPRAFTLPYSPGLEQQVAHAAHAEKAGVRGLVHTVRTARRGQQAQSPQVSMRFVRLPPARIVVKGQVDAEAAHSG